MQKINYPTEGKLILSIPSFEDGINTIFDPSLTNLKYAKEIHNFGFKDGSLKNGLGFSDLIKEISSTNEEFDSLNRDLKTLGSIERVFHFYKYNSESNTRDDKLILIDDDYGLYYINLYDQNKTIKSLRNIIFTSLPVGVRYRLNGEDVMIFSSETDNMVVWNGVDLPYEVLDAPKISSMAIHYERLFATVDKEKNSVWFSDDLDPTNWSVNLDEAGFIELIDERGALLKVVSFCDYIYIFRENGISRLTAYGDQSNFAVSNLFVSSGKIYASSVCVCGDRIIFLASDGLYRFDGVNTTKILGNIAKNIKNNNDEKISACYYNGCYYLACNYEFEHHTDYCKDTFFSNAILEIDINTYKMLNITHGVNVKYLTSFSTDKIEGVIALVNTSNSSEYQMCKIDNSGKYLESNLEKSWISNTSGVSDPNKQKTLKKIYVESREDFVLHIYHDNKETALFFNGSSLPIVKRVNIPLYNFSFKINSNSNNPSIKNFKFEFGLANGRI